MNCPFCGSEASRVVDSRPSADRKRRRRQCEQCGRRFTTYEMIELPLRVVVKRDGSLEPFDRNKLLSGIYSAIKKRPVTVQQVNAIADTVENAYDDAWNVQISSDRIGEIVLDELRDIDPIAYIRFASVYQDFKDVDSFIAAIASLKGRDDASDS